MGIEIVSTTDTSEAVNAAKGILADKAVVETEKSASAEAAPADSADEITEDSETTDDVSDENQDDESTSTDDANSEDKPAKTEDGKSQKKKGGFKKRIERFQKQLSQKDQELEYWKKEAMAGKPQPKAEQKAVEIKVEAAGKPKSDSFKTHEEYVEALTDWKLEQREKANEQKAREAQVKTEFQKNADTFKSRIEEFKKNADDFDELMNDVTVAVPPYVQEIFLTSENGPALMYELAKNPKELERISRLSPIPAAIEIGKLEAKLAKTSEKAESKETKTTKAPEPVKPVGAKGGSAKKSIDDPNLSQKEFEKLRAEQLKARQAESFR